MTTEARIRIRQIDGYRFIVDFGAAIPDLLVDEAAPIGDDAGPHPEQLLVASVANCLCASLVFALGKYKQDAGDVQAEASCRVARNAENRLRVEGIDVAITLGASADEMPRVDSAISQFQRFCTVSESVQTGVPVSVAVRDREGRLLT
ncbi:OsmC family protein [Hansschlegelia beijingensis]